jgi:hypothetical protein
MGFRNFNSLCKTRSSVFIRFESKGIRSRRVIMLIEISIGEPKHAAIVLWLIW